MTAHGTARWILSMMAATTIGQAALWGATITTDTLVDEMVDFDRLTKLPEPWYVTKQFSSYDPASKSPSQDWFANGDCGHYLRIEDVNGRKEHVMMDADGPGAIVRIWSANPKGTLRIYIDGNAAPAIEEPMTALLGGTVVGIPVPIAGEHSRGWNLYLPIPYARHCKVTSDDGGFYYHVNYRTYSSGGEVKSFTHDDIARLWDKIYNVAARLSSPRAGVAPPADRVKKLYDVSLKPAQSETIFAVDGPKEVAGFLVHLKAEDLDAAARAVVVTMVFDGEQTVECPLGDFFGTAPGLTPYASMPLGITAGDPQDLWCHWRMPFAKDAKITFRNMGDQNVRISGGVSTVPYTWDDRSMHFSAGWRIERKVPTRPFTDWTHLEVEGKGRFVGGALHIQNPVRGWWGEGDEKIYVDGEKFPSHFGTGTEDYYGYAWCCNVPFMHAYHNQPRCDGPGNYGNTSVNRLHIIDDIPFTASFKFDIENWHWAENSYTNRAAVSYWYARPGAKSFFKPLTKADVKLDVMGPLNIFTAKGALEGESLKVLDKTGGKVDRQAGFDFWSDESQKWWTEGKPGDKLTLGIKAPEAGGKHVIVCLTRAPDYGIVQLYVNGAKAGEPIDCFAAGVSSSGEIDLGSFDLAKGENKLTVEIVGANKKAIQAYMFGLDYVLLK